MSLRKELKDITEELKKMADNNSEGVNFFGAHGSKQISKFQEIEDRVFQIIEKYRQKNISALSEDDKEVLIMSGCYEHSREEVIDTGDTALHQNVRKIFESKFGDYSGISKSEEYLVHKLKRSDLSSLQTKRELSKKIYFEMAGSDMIYLNAILFDAATLYLYSYRENVKKILEKGLILKLDNIIREVSLFYNKHGINLTFKLSDDMKEEIVNLLEKRFLIVVRQGKFSEAKDLIYTTNLTFGSSEQACSFYKEILKLSKEKSKDREDFLAVLKDKLFLLSQNDWAQKVSAGSAGELQEQIDTQEKKLYLTLLKRVKEVKNNLFNPFTKKEFEVGMMSELKRLGGALDIFE
jgi:hypothetical protein